MCPGCWREVPPHLQADVLATWRTYRHAVSASRLPETIRTNRETYDRARAAALALFD